MLLLSTLLIFDIRPAFATATVGTDADDPAIWVNRAKPEASRILGTDKTEAPNGGLYVFDLGGKVVQRIGGLDRPNNVDVEGDIAVVTERKKERLRFFRIGPTTGTLVDATGKTRVFEGETGEDAAPMGVGLYRRPKDGALFAIVTPKAGPLEGHLAQYRVSYNPATKQFDLKLVRRFGTYSGKKETESVFVDDEQGFVYYSDETVGTRKYFADPDAVNAGREQSFFNRTGTLGDHEGIALWAQSNGTGYLVCTDQLEVNSIYRVFERTSGNVSIGAFRGGADSTDGIDMTSTPLGPRFPKGLFVAMNSAGKNFLVYDARDVLRGLGR